MEIKTHAQGLETEISPSSVQTESQNDVIASQSASGGSEQQSPLTETKTEIDDTPIQEKKGKSLFALGSILGAAIIIGAIVFAFFYFRAPKPTVSQTPNPATLVTPAVASPSATPTPYKNADITVEVLNGSGTTGLAAKYRKLLEAKGYDVTKTGNAPDQKGLTILASSSLDSQKVALIADLKSIFPTASISGVLTDGTNLLRITLGK